MPTYVPFDAMSLSSSIHVCALMVEVHDRSQIAATPPNNEIGDFMLLVVLGASGRYELACEFEIDVS